MISIYGINIYGTPWTSSNHMGFSSDSLWKKWNLINKNTDILLTHMPIFGMLDRAGRKKYDSKDKEISL